MKAFTIKKYGDPEEVLKMTEVNTPEVNKTQVLIKVKATTINDYDWSAVTGQPLEYRMLFGLSKPRFTIPGMEVAGVVESKGSDVNDLEVGDLVFGDISGFGFGTFAEYVSVDSRAVMPIPQGMSFADAVTIPHAGCLAYQGLITEGKLSSGMKVLINGGGGGVGTIGGQLAKHYECEVTGVDHEAKLALMRDHGFDHVIDYEQMDFATTGERYDLILDCKSMRSGHACLGALRKGGRYVTIGGRTSSMLSIVATGLATGLFTKKRMRILALKPNASLPEITALVDQGKIKCAIDGPYDFEDIPRLVQYFGTGAHKGKVVVQV